MRKREEARGKLSRYGVIGALAVSNSVANSVKVGRHSFGVVMVAAAIAFVSVVGVR